MVKLVDRETLLKEREEKKKVINPDGYDEVINIIIIINMNISIVYIVQNVLHY